jgi:hypothetical protein
MCKVIHSQTFFELLKYIYYKSIDDYLDYTVVMMDTCMLVRSIFIGQLGNYLKNAIDF